MKCVAAAVRAGEVEHDGASVIAVGHRLELGEFSIEQQPVSDGDGVAADSGLVVALDLARSSELVAEGDARDPNRALQDLRKELGLDYSDRVALAIEAPAALWVRLEPFVPWLREQLLAIEIRRGGLGLPAATRCVQVAGHTAMVSMLPVT